MKAVVMALVFFSMSAIAQQQVSKPPDSPPGKLLDIGGYRLHINCTGNRGPTVVLIAGGGDFSFDWSLAQAEVAGFTRVCSYDRAGLGWSDAGPTPRTMKQDAYELHSLLKAARIKAPYLIVGHSIGGLIARVYAEQYAKEVAGMVLIDPTHEDTVLMIQGKLVRLRARASDLAIPPVQTMKSSPPKPPAAEDLEQFQLNQKMFGAPKIAPPFDKLPASAQAMRLWFLSQSPRTAGGQNFLAEELQAMFTARAKFAQQLGDIPLIVLLPKSTGSSNPPPGIAADEWRRVNEEKRQQKLQLTNLSSNSKLIFAEKSGHHIQLDEPELVAGAIREVIESIKRQQPLKP